MATSAGAGTPFILEAGDFSSSGVSSSGRSGFTASVGAAPAYKRSSGVDVFLLAWKQY